MLLKNVKIGDHLEISLKGNPKNRKVYVSQVEEVLDRNQLVIHMPISAGQLVKLDKSSVFSLLFFTDKGMLRFDAKVIKHTVEDGFNFTIVSIISEGARIQRREFFRFTCLIPTKFSLFEKNGNDDTNVIVFDGEIKDIGGGGMRFVSNQDLNEEDKIKSIVVLGEEMIVAVGRVLHRQYLHQANYKFQYRLEFVGMQKSEQEKIVQYIFEQQRKKLQKTKV